MAKQASTSSAATLNEITGEIEKRSRDLAVYDRYYRGDHGHNFASDKFRNKFGRRLQSLRDNLCKAVVDAPVSRLEVINFAGENDLDLSAEAWSIWKRNRMPRAARSVHREAFKNGESFVIVWQDQETRKARIYPQRSAQCMIWTDKESGTTLKAAKLWSDGATKDPRQYLTVYYADQIEKYISTDHKSIERVAGTRWVPRDIPGEAWPLVNPFGQVPVFQFCQGDGHSILDDVIPLNDALNKTFCDLMVGAEYNSLRQRWISGIQFEKDEETGKAVLPFSHEDQAWYSEEDAAKFGNFGDAVLSEFLKSANDIRQEISRVTGIPAHYFNLNASGFPSGEALRTAEAPFTSIVEDAQLVFGESWARTMAFAIAIETYSPADAHQIEVQWRDPSPVTLTEQLSNALVKQQLGVSTTQILEELGYTGSDITSFAAANAAEKKETGAAIDKLLGGGSAEYQN